MRELQGRWPGLPIGVDGRSAEGLQSPHRPPMAVCGSWDARDGKRIGSRELPRSWLVRVGGDVGSVAEGRRQAGEWNGSQLGQGATELGIPRPALWQMQGEAACRAGEDVRLGRRPVV